MKKIAHRIGYCTSCGWVHSEIRRVRASDGNSAIIKALCVDCIKNQPLFVLCQLCGNTKCDNLYPVSIVRKMIGDNKITGNDQTCNIFLHLCAECRKIEHTEIIKRLNAPSDICDSCKDRFVCFTEKTNKAPQSVYTKGTLKNKQDYMHKRNPFVDVVKKFR